MSELAQRKSSLPLSDFVRVVPKWKNKAWLERLRRVSAVREQAEVLMVNSGRRDAATIHVSPETLDISMAMLNEKQLVLTPLRKSAYHAGVAHQHRSVKDGDPFFWYCCVTRDAQSANRFEKADRDNDHLTMAGFLGFPACCARYFAVNYPSNYDSVWTMFEGVSQVKGYPEANCLLRYFGARIVSHLPCSPVCEETRKVGAQWLDVMNAIDAETTGNLVKLLSSEMTWDSYHGVVQVETPYFVGVTHSFPYMDRRRVIRWKSIGNAQED